MVDEIGHGHGEGDDVAGDVRPIYVNKRELAEALSVSIPTLDRLIRDNVIRPAKGGANGVPYEFDLVASIKAKQAQDKAEAEAEEKRRAAINETLELFGANDLPQVEGDDGALSPAQRAKLFEAEQRRLYLLRSMGALVRFRDVELAGAAIGVSLRQSLQSLPTELRQRFGLDDAAARAIAEAIDDALRRTVHAIRDAIDRARQDEQTRAKAA